MIPWLDDGDVRLYHGDVLEVLRGLPDESVDCVVTSPPYWGLRDYGTGSWDGGDDVWHTCSVCDGQTGNQSCSQCGGAGSWLGPCDHRVRKDGDDPRQGTFRNGKDYAHGELYGERCGRCNARRVDRQMGLEPTPDLFVAGMVAVFREVRRVLAPHGTCWVNLGDSYAANRSYQVSDSKHQAHDFGGSNAQAVPDGLKPKDLVGIPWRVAFALQADGWWLRSDIIWGKPNPMPESVTDRPTKAHEYVFLLTKASRYWFDTEAVREPAEYGRRQWSDPEAVLAAATNGYDTRPDHGVRAKASVTGGDPSAGRNVRSVWSIATQPYPEAHFATFPEELARRCIIAGCPTRVCRVCGKPSERIVERERGDQEAVNRPKHLQSSKSGLSLSGNGSREWAERGAKAETVGWSDCACTPYPLFPVSPSELAAVSKWRPGVTLDPFIGSGTVAKVARDHQRHAIGIDLNQTYLELAARRLQQLSLLTGDAA